MKTARALLFLFAILACFARTALATPYASCFSNNLDGTMSFYINESGGDVTITYDDGTTAVGFDGVDTGTNLALGQYSFPLGTHTNYTISIHKIGAGVPSLITSQFFTPRGVAVNTRPASPYFGMVYANRSSATGIFALNPDLSFTYGAPRTGGVGWIGNGLSPYRLSITPDDYLMVGDASAGNAGVYRIDPTIQTNTPVFGFTNEAAGLAAGVFGTIQSRPLILGNPSTGPFSLLDVDGDYNFNSTPYNSLLVYSNLTLATLPWTNPPSFIGPAIGVDFESELLGDNEYPGLTQGPLGYVYASTYRNNLSNPLIQIYDPANGYAQVWNSQENAPASGDFFLTTSAGITQGIVDSTVSPDAGWLVGVTVDNWFVITPLLATGIPDTSKLFLNTPTSYSGNARGIAMDIADNIYLASSGIGAVQTWTLGLTTTAITTGNSNGATAFSLIEPSNAVTVVATTPAASQGGANGTVGTPVPGVFTITRTNAQNDYSSAFTVNYTLSGSASNGTYTVSPSGTPVSTNSITFAPGENTVTVSITPTTANVPRPTTTVVLSLNAGSDYLASQPRSDTVYIQNTSSNELTLSIQNISMYKGFSNDYAYATITRLGDTNTTVTIPADAFSYGGTPVSNIDFTPAAALTFSPGEITLKAKLFPLDDGAPAVHTNNTPYTGNELGTITLNQATGYGVSSTNSSSFTIVDDIYKPGPTPIFSDPLTDTADASHWNITFGSGDPANQNPSDYDVEFGYDLLGNNATFGQIGLPPSGATTCLRVTCNRTSPFAEAGVNVYYTNQLFAGNYSVRFSMNIIQDSSTANDVAGPIFGVNHNGMETNWFADNITDTGSQPFWASDGVWYYVDETPGGTSSDFQEYTGDGSPATNEGWTEVGTATAASFATVFKNPTVFTATNGNAGAASGVPANISTYLAPSVAADQNWADVEIRQFQNVVTMEIDHTNIFKYTNTTQFTNGYLMLGYETPMTGAQHDYAYTPEAGVYYSGLQVVELSPFIAAQPQSIFVPQGAPATFTAVAQYGAAPYTNVWFNGTNSVFTNVVSTTVDDASYTIAAATVANDGSYTVSVSDSAGAVTSSAAVLTVEPPPVATNLVVVITTNAGASVTLPAQISGIQLGYQWFGPLGTVLTNGGKISGATTSALTITNVQSGDAGTYIVLATNLAGVASNQVQLVIASQLTAPTFSSITLSGGNASLTVTTTNGADTASSFILQASTNVAGPYINVPSATFTSGTSNTFNVTLPQSGPTEFYRIELQ